MTIDVWMQHPTLRHANHEMFDSLRRWMGVDRFEEEIPFRTDDPIRLHQGQTASAGPTGVVLPTAVWTREPHRARCIHLSSLLRLSQKAGARYRS